MVALELNLAWHGTLLKTLLGGLGAPCPSLFGCSPSNFKKSIGIFLVEYTRQARSKPTSFGLGGARQETPRPTHQCVVKTCKVGYGTAGLSMDFIRPLPS
mmetsp:Transcript_17600/g.26574  ORF Transcript_17600/g.26574 Transcript_17600/m.26574 type:complete len:100 (+) Transcript_17600:118-417(+)